MEGHGGQHTPPTVSSELRLQGRRSTHPVSPTHPLVAELGPPWLPSIEAHRSPPACELPAIADDPVGSGGAALLLAFYQPILVGDGCDRCSSIPERPPGRAGSGPAGRSPRPFRLHGGCEGSGRTAPPAAPGLGHLPPEGRAPGSCPWASGRRLQVPGGLPYCLFSVVAEPTRSTWQTGSHPGGPVLLGGLWLFGPHSQREASDPSWLPPVRESPTTT